MNQGDRLRITIKGVPDNFDGGVLTIIEDLTTTLLTVAPNASLSASAAFRARIVRLRSEI